MQNSTGLILFLLISLALIIFILAKFIKKSNLEISSNPRKLIYAGSAVFGLAFIFAFLPFENDAKNSVLTLFGLAITAIIAISSTTFVSNAMAGVMLKTIKNFSPGDFISVDEHFGRVSGMGFLSTEIQTKNSNLTTLPNMYLIANPVTVMLDNNTLVDATLSLGYDISHHEVEKILKDAAKKSGLKESFVQITELGDFSISYRVAGFLQDTKLILTARSNLRKQIIDSLHFSDIEIVSPAFMNQTQFSPDRVFMYKPKKYQEKNNSKTEKTKVFDKANKAEMIEDLNNEIKKLNKEIESISSEKIDGYELIAERSQKKIARISEEIKRLSQEEGEKDS